MQTAPAAFNPDLLELLNSAYAACRDLRREAIGELSWEVAEPMMALRLMASVAAGERDPGRLKELALQVIDDSSAGNSGEARTLNRQPVEESGHNNPHFPKTPTLAN